MNILLDFIRFNYIYSFSFKQFGLKNSYSIQNIKALSFYLAAGTKNSEISLRSSIKHEFTLSESQRLNISNFAVIATRKDDEFGRPYFKPIIFKYNYYWENYSRKSIFVRDIVDLYFSSTFEIFPNVSSNTCSFLDFKFFKKCSLRKKIYYRNFKFKKRWKKKFSYFPPFFKFRANGLLFVYKPISFNFFFNKIYFDLCTFNNKLFNLFFVKKFKINTFSKFKNFFFSEKRYSKMYKKKSFENRKIFFYTFFKKKFFSCKFKKFFKKLFRIRTNNIFTKPVLRKLKYKYSKVVSFKFFYDKYTKIRNFLFFYNFKKKIKLIKKMFFPHFQNKFFKKIYFEFFPLIFNIFKFKNIKNYYFPIFKRFFKFFYKFLCYYFQFYRTRKVRFSYFLYSIYFFNNFYRTCSKRLNFSNINVFRMYFCNLSTLNKIFLNFSSFVNYKNTFFFSIIFSIFFKSKNVKLEINKFISIKFIEIRINTSFKKEVDNSRYRYTYFCDSYKSFFNTYNIFSSNRYNDIIKLYKNIFNPNFYSYKVSSSRKVGKRSIFSVRKVSNYSVNPF